VNSVGLLRKPPRIHAMAAKGGLARCSWLPEAAGLLFLPMQAFYRIRSPAEMSSRGKAQRRNPPGEDSIEPLPSPPCLRASVVRFSTGRNHGGHGGTEPPLPRFRRTREWRRSREFAASCCASRCEFTRGLSGSKRRISQMPLDAGGGRTPLPPHASVLSNTKPGGDVE